MRNKTLLPVFLLLILSTACSTEEELTGPGSSEPQQPDSPLFVISDAAHLGTEGFYFLPPMVPDPGSAGVFDPSFLSFTTVRICELGNEGCIEPPLIEFSHTNDTGSPGLHIPDGADHYLVNWHTDEFDLDADKLYRIQVQVGDLVIGYADVNPVRTGNELKNVDTGEFIALKDGRTLPIKFTIESSLAGVGIIGVEGGNLKFYDNRVSLLVDPTALAAETAITVEPADLAGAIPGTSYEFGPSGLEFYKSSILTICYDENDLPAETSEGDLRLGHSIDGSVWEDLPSEVDQVSNCVSGQISGFSSYSVLDIARKDYQLTLVPWAILDFERRPDADLPSLDWWPMSDSYVPWGIRLLHRRALTASDPVEFYEVYIHNNSFHRPSGDPTNHAIVGGSGSLLIGGTTVLEFDPQPNYVYFEITERADSRHLDNLGREWAGWLAGPPIRINGSIPGPTYGLAACGIDKLAYTTAAGADMVSYGCEVYLGSDQRISSLEIFGESFDSDVAYHTHHIDNIETKVSTCGSRELRFIREINALRLRRGLHRLVLDDRLYLSALEKVTQLQNNPPGVIRGTTWDGTDGDYERRLLDYGYPSSATGIEVLHHGSWTLLEYDVLYSRRPDIVELLMTPELTHVGAAELGAYPNYIALDLGSANEQLSAQKAIIPGSTACGSG